MRMSQVRQSAVLQPKPLFLGTNIDNAQDKCAKGRQRGPVGELNRGCKLAELQVREIRERYAGGESTSVIALCFGVSARTIRDIVSCRYWKHVA